MKVSVTITLDVDPYAWRQEYGYDGDAATIAALVRDDARAAVTGAFAHMPDVVTVKR